MSGRDLAILLFSLVVKVHEEHSTLRVINGDLAALVHQAALPLPLACLPHALASTRLL